MLLIILLLISQLSKIILLNCVPFWSILFGLNATKYPFEKIIESVGDDAINGFYPKFEKIFKKNYDDETIKKIYDKFFNTKVSHDTIISRDELDFLKTIKFKENYN